MMEENGLEGLARARDGGCGNDGGGSGDGECAARLAGRRPGSAEELMRISVNLANRPFIELRPLFARLRLAMVVLALLAVGLGFALHSLNAKAACGAGADGCAEGEDAAVSDERQANEARMHQPQNMAVLERSRFLNAVFAREELQLDGRDDGPREGAAGWGAGDQHRAGRSRRKAT